MCEITERYTAVKCQLYDCVYRMNIYATQKNPNWKENTSDAMKFMKSAWAISKKRAPLTMRLNYLWRWYRHCFLAFCAWLFNNDCGVLIKMVPCLTLFLSISLSVFPHIYTHVQLIIALYTHPSCWQHTNASKNKLKTRNSIAGRLILIGFEYSYK